MYLLLVGNDLLSSAEIREMFGQSPEDTDIINCLSAATLLRTAEKLNPDVIIVDYAMVQREQEKYFVNLRTKSRESHILALLDPDNHEKLYKVIEDGGIDDYIVKPMRKEDLLTRVQIAAKRKKEGRNLAEPDRPKAEDSSDRLPDLHETGPHASESEPDLDQELFAEAEMDDISDESDSLQLDDQEEVFEDETIKSPYENDHSELWFEEETPESKPEAEEEPAFEDDLKEYLSEEEFASDQDLKSELETPELDSYDFDDIMSEEVKEPFYDEEITTHPQTAGSGIFDDIPSVEPTNNVGQESPPGSFGEDEDFKPVEQDIASRNDSFKSFEEIITSPPEDDMWGHSREEFSKPESEDAGPAADKPASELFDSDISPAASQEQMKADSSLQPEEDNNFDNLFDEKPWPAEQPFKRKDIREYSSLHGESADEFLFGKSTQRDENYDKTEPDEFSDHYEDHFEGRFDDDYDDKPKKHGRPQKAKNGRSGFARVLSFIGNILFVLLLLFMATLSFFLIQSRISGGVPQVAGYQMYIVLSGSMSPEFDTGSLAFVRETETDQLGVGDIITYRSQADSDSLTTHRIVEVQTNERTQFITRGDANTVNDPNPVPAENIVGEVTGSVPYLGYIFSFVQTQQGLILLIFVPGVLIILFELGKIIKYLTQADNGKKREIDKKHSRFAEE